MNTDTPRTEARVVLCNHGEYRVDADFARQLERELFAFKRSNEREAATLADRVKLLEEQRKTLNETCHALRAQLAALSSPNIPGQPRPLGAVGCDGLVELSGGKTTE